MNPALETLQSALGHRFARSELLTQALTHRSHGANNNERLEFLGDGVLNCVIGALLYERFPELKEGQLSRLRANLAQARRRGPCARPPPVRAWGGGGGR